ncbi:contractile injection system tape measure protein [Pelagicoccus enzymogenes]|uniref:contractile injection system tape measure protein n=1 Tax=Pelagicoccus enzymogenes TaxID=2773457 RepID=UPI00280F48DD|nr:contractile injection system tape measure protein [Pelagicoccus enzymogenes]MDQ8198951.1 contractile injection system tape measure protein [Pelagicoccus enzymogenes]
MSSHTVHQLLLDVSLPPGSDTRRLDERLRDFAMGPLAQHLEKILDSRDPETSIRIEKLEIDLGAIPVDEFLKNSASRIASAVSNQLGQKKSDIPAHEGNRFSFPRFPIQTGEAFADQPQVTAQDSPQQSANNAESRADALLSFLESGHLPWWFPASRWPEAIHPSKWSSPAKSKFLQGLRQALQNSPHAAIRLARAIAPQELKTLLTGNAGNTIPNPENPEHANRQLLHSYLSQLPAPQQPPQSVLQTITPTVPPENTEATTTKGQTKPVANEEAPPVATNDLSWKNNDTGPSDTLQQEVPLNQDLLGFAENKEIAPIRPDGLFVSNAGLVLLNPFLSRLFHSLGYLSESKTFLPTTRWRAAQLLQFLATGQSGLPEHTLVMEKALCGITTDEVAEFPELSSEETEAAETMLQAAIDHWKALGKTSLDGLRQSFLQREGLLYLDSQPVRLQVEKQAYDMLLDRLPWQFRYIHFPWLKQPLLVQWRS